jgi:hypothetical protein
MAGNVTIKVLRALSSQINEGTNVLEDGEIAYITDTQQIFIGKTGTGSNDRLMSGRTLTGTTLPSFDVNIYPEGTLFLIDDSGDTGEENDMYVSNGSAWVKVGVNHLSDLAGSLDDISDGTNFGKVLLSELTAGQVSQIRAVSGATDVTGDTINTHITDDTKHRLINDAGTGVTELWSANKITSELSLISSGAASSLLPPVQNLTLLSAIDTITTGTDAQDKTLIHVEDNGLFRLDIQSTATPDGTDIIQPDDRGTGVDGRWIRMTDPTNNHNNLSNLDGGTTGQYYHMTSAEHTEATQLATGSLNGLMSSGDFTKLSNIQTGAEVNQVITVQNGLTTTALTGDDVLLGIDYGLVGEMIEINAIGGTESAGSIEKPARIDHEHILTIIDAGVL